MTVGNALHDLSRRLEQGGIESPRRNVEWMLTHVTVRSRATLYAYPEHLLRPAEKDELLAMVDRRMRGEPLQYILGEVEFCGLTLRVSSSVLIPRPETESVVHRACGLIEGIPHPRILDVGTGSGCIALALQSARPDADVVGVDVSAEALQVAQANARANGLDVAWLRADVLDAGFGRALGTSRFDLLVSNPPYVPPNEAESLAPDVLDHEPHLALFTDGDPLQFYRTITLHARTLLAPGGWLVFETHADYAGEVRGLLKEECYLDVALELDLGGLPRIVYGRMTGE